ncbi:MAG: ComF family protein, partial [bacterium]
MRSVPLGLDGRGHEVFETTRSEIGEALYRLKYKNDRAWIKPIAKVAAIFIRSRLELTDIRVLLAVPPSNTDRRFQPVTEIVEVMGKDLKIPV